MFEILTLSVMGSVSVFFPIWRSFKKGLQNNSAVSTGHTTNINEVVAMPRSQIEPNFHVTYEMQLLPDEKEFVQNFLKNVVNRINSGEMPLWETIRNLPQSFLDMMRENLADPDMTFSDLNIYQKSDVIARYLFHTYTKQTSSTEISVTSATRQSSVNTTSSSAAGDGTPDGGDLSLILWLIFSLCFTGYTIFRIATLKQNDKSTNSL